MTQPNVFSAMQILINMSPNVPQEKKVMALRLLQRNVPSKAIAAYLKMGICTVHGLNEKLEPGHRFPRPKRCLSAEKIAFVKANLKMFARDVAKHLGCSEHVVYAVRHGRRPYDALSLMTIEEHVQALHDEDKEAGRETILVFTTPDVTKEREQLASWVTEVRSTSSTNIEAPSSQCPHHCAFPHQTERDETINEIIQLLQKQLKGTQ